MALLLVLSCLLSLTSGIAAAQPLREQTQTTVTQESGASEETASGEEASESGKPATRATSTSSATGLYFGFNGQTSDDTRYKEAKYGSSYNYDAIDTDYNNKPKHWRTSGFETVTLAHWNDNGGGGYIKGANITGDAWIRACVNNQTTAGLSTNNYKLNYTVGADDYFVARLRIDDVGTKTIRLRGLINNAGLLFTTANSVREEVRCCFSYRNPRRCTRLRHLQLLREYG